MNTTENERKIRDLLDARADAIHSKDVNGVMRCFEPEAAHFNLIPPLQADHSLPLDLGNWFSTFSGPIGYQMQDVTIVCDENIGFAYCLSRIHGCKTDGARPDVWIRETFGLRKFGGMWMIVHIHDSAPFYMDGTFRAALDLKP